MSLSVETLAVARKYTDDSLAGAGAVAGVPCKIQSITAITGGNRVTFLWTDNNGDDHTSAMDVMNGVDGEDGKGIQSVTVNAQDHLIITYTDGTTVDAGEIEIHNAVDSVNGQTGAVVLAIPSKTSDLTNDSGFATTSDVSTALSDYTTTADLTTLLAAKQDTLTFDNVPTENSNNPVKSSGIYSANQNIYEVIGENGAKNKEPFDIDVVKALNTTGTWTGNSYALNGITFVFADDGKVTVSGTASALCSINISGNYDLNGDYIITGCPSGGDISTYSLRIYDSSATAVADDIGEGISFTANNLANCRTHIIVRTNVAISTPIVFAPMIRDSKDTDTTYQPYAKTNQELTAEMQTLTNQANDMVNVLGSKNLLYNPPTSFTDNGLTFTTNDDGEVSIVGTHTRSSGSTNLNIFGNQLEVGTYKFSIEGNILGTCLILCTDSAVGVGTYKRLAGLSPARSEEEFTYTQADKIQYPYIWVQLSVNYTNVDVNTVYKPMVRLASITDPTYVPYAKTNQQLTKDTTGLLDNTEVNGAVNILPYPYSDSNKVDHGVTFIDNGDGTVSVNGTATDDNVGAFVFIKEKAGVIPAGTYKCTFEGWLGNNRDWWYIYNRTIGQDIASPTKGNLFTYNGTDVLYFRYTVMNGKTVSTTLKPMITVASYNGDYVHYAKSNKELTDESLTKSYEPVQLSTPRVSFNSVTIRKIGKIVNINFYATLLVDLTSEQTTLFQIPSDIRTSTKQYAIAANINTNTAYRLEVNDNNNVNVNHGGITAGQEIVGNITYELL